MKIPPLPCILLLRDVLHCTTDVLPPPPSNIQHQWLSDLHPQPRGHGALPLLPYASANLDFPPYRMSLEIRTSNGISFCLRNWSCKANGCKAQHKEGNDFDLHFCVVVFFGPPRVRGSYQEPGIGGPEDGASLTGKGGLRECLGLGRI